MTGRLLGSVVLPPKNPAEWEIGLNNRRDVIYGCALCRRLLDPSLNGREYFYEVVDGTQRAVDYYIQIYHRHGPSFQLSELPDDVSICFSVGHMYFRPLDVSNVNLRRYKVVEADTITVVDEDVPYLALVYHDHTLYNLSASIITDVVSSAVLVNLAKAHHLLQRSISTPQVYEAMRLEFLRLADEYMAPPEVKLDTPYGQKAITLLVSQLRPTTEHGLRLNKLQESGAFGVMHRTNFVNDKLIFKYQLLDSITAFDIWENEERNVGFINSNLSQRPDLPYPYTYSVRRCRVNDPHILTSLTVPYCPSTGRYNVGLLVQEYIESIGTLYDYLNGHYTESPPMIVEALATLAEAHQGSTVKYHFMHLDSHPNNFLVCDCSKARNCTANRGRVVNLGGANYWFNPSRRLYLIDFGLSHFLDDSPTECINSDVGGQITSELLPAIDYITTIRTTLPNMISRMLEYRGKLVGDVDVVDELNSLVRALDQCRAMLVITAVMCAKNVVQLINARQDSYIRRYGGDDTGEYQVDVNWLSRRVYELANDGLDTVRLFLIDYVNWMFELLEKEQRTDFSDIPAMLCGYYFYNDVDRNVIASIRQIYQRHFEHLSASVLDALNIRPAPTELSGIPLCLWYMYQYGVDVPIRLA